MVSLQMMVGSLLELRGWIQSVISMEQGGLRLCGEYRYAEALYIECREPTMTALTLGALGALRK
ncbi:hypothetical protein TU82_23450 [Pseudomonas orientalis]|nr:hypothetical protein TU82_23450 [Pseudomonas orientalis]